MSIRSFRQTARKEFPVSTVKAQIIQSKEYPQFCTKVQDFLLSHEELALFNSPEYSIFPGFCDVHVHFREPGFFYKESILTGSQAAAHGGYTAVCTMPNLNPVPDSAEHLKEQTDLIEKDAVIRVYPFGAITVGEKGEVLADLEAMAPAAIGFSDDGRGVQSEDMMRAAMVKTKALGKIISAHCEDNSLLHGGYIHDGEYARLHGHKGICSESEWGPIARDILLVKETGCPYHVDHISTKESVDIIRKAKAEGVDITCETAPHYLVLNDMDLQENGRFKMNPPIRSEEDRLALIAGIQDGTIDMIATDHAPHSAEEKAKGLAGSAFGVVGIETAFQMLYTYLVEPGLITMDRLIELLVDNPRKRFGIPLETDFSIWDLREESTVDPDTFLSKGRATPLEGMKIKGKCLLTVCDGKVVYRDPAL
ncbi:MAG: dihydroorotase [Clostridiales bacterium]|nr:dihydroorotase [Clostridiales bacterium]